MRSTTAIRFISTLIFAANITFIDVDNIYAAQSNNKTPYGDYCSRISRYGTHKSLIDIKRAKEALHHYYGAKGLKIEIISQKGRFLKAAIKEQDQVVDIIIFDRRSGRIRTVY